MSMKRQIRTLFRKLGYNIESVGDPNSPSGDDMLHDVNIFLGRSIGNVLFDVGANIGQSIDAFRREFRSPIIYSFEPSPRTFPQLMRTHGEIVNRIEQIALSQNRGTMDFYVIGEYSVNDSLLPTGNKNSQTVQVETWPLDGYCQDRQIERIDFLKIDTQGNDLNVLRGARSMLEEHRIRAFCVELLFRKFYVGQPSYLEILSAIHAAGYRPLGFYDNFYLNGKLSHCDACFVAL
jgi:FkbM family methyltransferase